MMNTPEPDLPVAEALKPCPFCGNAPLSISTYSGKQPAWAIFCHVGERCLATASACERTEAETIAAWNTRATPIPDTSAGERMREALADFATSAAFASRGALDSDTVFCEIYTPGYQPQKKGSFGFYVKDLRNLLALAALALQGPSGKTGGEG